MSLKKRKGPRMAKDSKDQAESTSRITGSKSCSLELLRDLYARRPLVSASHIIQAEIDLSIGEDGAYIMNRKKKEKSVHSEEDNVYVLDLFVKVPSSTSP